MENYAGIQNTWATDMQHNNDQNESSENNTEWKKPNPQNLHAIRFILHNII